MCIRDSYTAPPWGGAVSARSLVEDQAVLTALANDIGLLAEEYDPGLQRLVGNFPQAFTHVGLVSTAINLDRVTASPARERAEPESAPTG